MAELTNPVVRRQPGDPLLYVMARRSDGWRQHGMAFLTREDIERAGFVIGPWGTDEHGDYAPLTRV
jgi:hypothetical protein